MNDAKSFPKSGTKLDIKLNDTRWPSAEGWAKMQKVYRGSFGGEQSNITIHYVINETLKLMDDFKIVFPK